MMKNILLLLLLIPTTALAAGRLQNSDFKTEADLTGAGGTAAQLLNDTKIYITGNGINKTLDDAIVDGDIGGKLTAKGNLFGFSTVTQECVLDKTDGKLLTVDSTATCGFDFKDAPISTTLTTKGDIQTFDTANARLPVGADGTFLVADSAEATGLKWSDTISGTLNPVTDWTTGTCSASWTNTPITCSYRRVGDSAEIQVYSELIGTPVGTNLAITIPSEIPNMDASKIIHSAENQQSLGYGTILDAGTLLMPTRIQYKDADEVYINPEQDYAASSVNPINVGTVAQPTYPFTFASGDQLSATFRVPIVGWSSGLDAAVANKSLTHDRYYLSAGQSILSSYTDVIYDTQSVNTNNAFSGKFNTSTGVFTETENGKCYSVTAQATILSTSDATAPIIRIIATSGEIASSRDSHGATTNAVLNVSAGKVCLDSGETLKVQASTGDVTRTSSSGESVFIDIQEVPSDFVIAGTFAENQSKCQTKFLSSDLTTDTTDVADLRFTSLTIGKKYRIFSNLWGRFTSTGGDDAIALRSVHNAALVCYPVVSLSQPTTSIPSTTSATCDFTATATSLTHNAESITTGNSVDGNGTATETWVRLCELPESVVETTEW